MHKGLFITFEGIDGCGKSTQVSIVAKRLVDSGVDCIVTREPGGPAIAEKIRQILLDPANKAMSNSCEVLLYLAARAQHVHETIMPALESGRVVLCDRFTDATMAYQGYGRQTPLDTLFKLNTFATQGLVPDMTFVFDIPLSVAGIRLKQTGKAPDRLEGDSRAFHERIRQGYHSLAAAHPDRIVMLDGEKSPEELCSAVVAKLNGKHNLAEKK